MKVCLIYSGFMRTWDRCRDNHRENIYTQNENVTAYFHTDKDPFNKGFDIWGLPHYFIPIPEKLFYPDPFAYVHPYSDRKSPEGSVVQTLRQWQCNFVAFSIVPSTFDVYVRMRPDLMFNGPLKLQKPEPKTVYIPQGMDYGGINDQCAYGDYDSMKVYYQVFENYHFLWRDKGITFNSEVMQKANLEDKGINVVRFGSPQHDLIR